MLSPAFRLLLALSTLGLSLPVVACGASSSEAQRSSEYETNGTIRALDLAHHGITIQHEDVPGYMPAMTMPFELANDALVEGLSVGDAVHFRFRAEGGGRHVVVAIARR